MLKIINTNKTRVGYDFYADIAERMVEKRSELGITQKQLSARAGLPITTISSYESVKARCKEEDLQKLASALEVTFDWLIGAEYDDPDGQTCLYSVRREKEREDIALFFKSSSPQGAFLEAHKWSRLVKVVWFEPRDRAIVTLEGRPIRKSDYEGKLKKRKSDDMDLLEL